MVVVHLASLIIANYLNIKASSGSKPCTLYDVTNAKE